MLFSIAGHTKNACDRWFNTLKRLYRRQNIMTMRLLISALETHERITVQTIKEGDFKKYSGWLDLFYKKIEPGKCLSSHLFSVIADEGEELSMKIFRDTIKGTKEFVQENTSKTRKMRAEERMALLKDRSELSIIPDPLIPPLKQNELYQQWRQVVDKQYWNEICPKPSDDVLKFRKQYNKDKKERKKRKAKAKEIEQQRRLLLLSSP